MRRSEVLGEEAVEASRENASKASGLEANPTNAYHVKPEDTGWRKRRAAEAAPEAPSAGGSTEAPNAGG